MLMALEGMSRHQAAWRGFVFSIVANKIGYYWIPLPITSWASSIVESYSAKGQWSMWFIELAPRVIDLIECEFDNASYELDPVARSDFLKCASMDKDVRIGIYEYTKSIGDKRVDGAEALRSGDEVKARELTFYASKPPIEMATNRAEFIERNREGWFPRIFRRCFSTAFREFLASHQDAAGIDDSMTKGLPQAGPYRSLPDLVSLLEPDGVTRYLTRCEFDIISDDPNSKARAILDFVRAGELLRFESVLLAMLDDGSPCEIGEDNARSLCRKWNLDQRLLSSLALGEPYSDEKLRRWERYLTLAQTEVPKGVFVVDGTMSSTVGTIARWAYRELREWS